MLVVDFGAQYAQLIARRVRELHVFSEIVNHRITADEVAAKQPAAIILSGGPASVNIEGTPRLDPAIYELGVPIFGICYGAQLIAAQLGGTVGRGMAGEYGRAHLTRTADSSVLHVDIPDQHDVWMSHFDAITEPPPGFRATASTKDAPVAVLENDERRIWGVQFHPEVVHSPHGMAVLRTFLHDLAGCDPSWRMASVIDEQVAKIRAQVGDQRAICALSGGVDSSVAAALVHKAIGHQLTCIYVDTGLMRKDESAQIVETYGRNMNLELIHVDAGDRYFEALAGVTEPETKRKIIGEQFIRIFEEHTGGLTEAAFLVQGTLYPDLIESGGADGTADVIKSHHNVGGLPEDMTLELVEPLRDLFKDEVRALGTELGLPDEMVWRQPFPGPGLGVRIIGEVTPDKVATLQEADAIVARRDRLGRTRTRDLAGLRCAARHPISGSHGGRAHLRPPDHHPCRDQRRCDDRRLGEAAVRPAREDVATDHQRGARHQPGRLRHHLEAARHDRVGVNVGPGDRSPVSGTVVAASQPIAAAIATRS